MVLTGTDAEGVCDDRPTEQDSFFSGFGTIVYKQQTQLKFWCHLWSRHYDQLNPCTLYCTWRLELQDRHCQDWQSQHGCWQKWSWHFNKRVYDAAAAVVLVCVSELKLPQTWSHTFTLTEQRSNTVSHRQYGEEEELR